MTDEPLRHSEPTLSAEQLAEKQVGRAKAIKGKLHAKEAFVTLVRGNRHKVQWHKDKPEVSALLCNGCGGSFIARGYCTNCGAPASIGAAAESEAHEPA